MSPIRMIVMVALAFALLTLAALAAFAVGLGLAVARFWARRTRGDGPIEPAAWEPETIGVVFVPAAYQPGDLGPAASGPAAFAAADALLDAHLRACSPPAHCPWCGRKHESESGAAFCYEMRREGATMR